MNEPENNPRPTRRRPVHLPLLASGSKTAIIFLTVCVADRKPVLATPVMHRHLHASWQKSGRWLVGRYVIMPDHVHLFCSPGTMPPVSLSVWVAYWKRLVAISAGSRFWQKNFWDTELRRHQNCEQKWEYVRANPIRAGLVTTSDDWPYQGEMNVLSWHD